MGRDTVPRTLQTGREQSRAANTQGENIPAVEKGPDSREQETPMGGGSRVIVSIFRKEMSDSKPRADTVFNIERAVKT